MIDRWRDDGIEPSKLDDLIAMQPPTAELGDLIWTLSLTSLMLPRLTVRNCA